MDTLFNRDRHGFDATLNRIHYSVCLGAPRQVQPCSNGTTTKSLFRADSNLKVAEIYLYVDNGCFETISRPRNDERGSHGLCRWIVKARRDGSSR